MAALPEDITNLDEPKSYREMFQRIMWLMQQDRDDRQDDRELLESFISKQDVLNAKMDDRMKSLEGCNIEHAEAIKTLKDASKKWDVVNSLATAVAIVMSAFGLKGS